MNIDIKSENCLFITLGNITYYLDNSTGENIIQAYDEQLGSEYEVTLMPKTDNE